MVENNVNRHVDDAKAVINAVLPLNVDKRIKKNVINLMIWHISGSDATEKSRYITEKAKNCPDSETITAQVNPLGNLAVKILENPLSFDTIMQSVISCTVSKDELKELSRIDKENPGLQGWQRFKKAQITIYDTEKCEYLSI